MAEVIGVVSGAITFATVLVQIGKTIITLKECYHDLRDAPDDLRKLVQQIEIFGKILANVEEDLSRNPNPGLENSEAALQSLAYCKEAANELDTVCNDIVRDVKSPSRLRRSFKSVKIVMQKGKIEKHMDHLRNVIQLLMWSEQCYHRALTHAHIQAQSQLIIETMVKLDTARSSSDKVRTTTTMEGAESFVNDTKSVVSQDKGLKFAQNSSYKWRLILPRWITSEVLEVGGMKAPGGWNWYLRAYGVIPFNAKAAGLAGTGDIKGLQDLFASGQASPFDRIDSSNGISLLHMVGRENRTKMISFLLDQGADPNCSDHLPLGSFSHYQSTALDLESLVPSMRVMFRHIDLTYQSEEEWAVSVLSKFLGTPEEFSFLQQHICPSFYQLSKQIRLRVGLSMARAVLPLLVDPSTPKVIRIVLKMDILEPDDFKFCQELNSTLIHYTAKQIGVCQQFLQRSGGAHAFQSTIGAWIGLCHDFLSVGIDIHYMIDGRTPLISCIEGWLPDLSPPAANQFVVPLWLEQLEAVGVDLSEYGKAEEFIWKNQTILREFWVWDGISKMLIPLRVIGFTYGPSPKDWHLWMSDPTDSYVGEFWDMIERPVEVMPGAWPQE